MISDRRSVAMAHGPNRPNTVAPELRLMDRRFDCRIRGAPFHSLDLIQCPQDHVSTNYQEAQDRCPHFGRGQRWDERRRPSGC